MLNPLSIARQGIGYGVLAVASIGFTVQVAQPVSQPPIAVGGGGATEPTWFHEYTGLEAGVIYDTHRIIAKGRIRLTGKAALRRVIGMAPLFDTMRIEGVFDEQRRTQVFEEVRLHNLFDEI